MGREYKELDTKLTELRKEQASGQGNKGALAVEAAKIKNELTAVRSARADVGRKIDDLSVAFEEEKQPANKLSSSKSTPPPPPPPSPPK